MNEHSAPNNQISHEIISYEKAMQIVEQAANDFGITLSEFLTPKYDKIHRLPHIRLSIEFLSAVPISSEKPSDQWGTIIAWARSLEVSQKLLRRRMNVNGDSSSVFYVENEIRLALGELLVNPRDDGSGSITEPQTGHRYIHASVLYDSHDIDSPSLWRRIRAANVPTIRALSKGAECTFLLEEEARRAIALLVATTEVKNDDEQIVINGIVGMTCAMCCRKFCLNNAYLNRLITDSDLKPIGLVRNRAQYIPVYSVADLNTLDYVKERKVKFNKIAEDGTCEVDGVKAVSLNFFADVNKLDVTMLRREVKNAGIPVIGQATNASGQIIDVYPSEQVRALPYVDDRLSGKIPREPEDRWQKRYTEVFGWDTETQGTFPGRHRVWLGKQVEQARQGKLSEERLQALKDEGVDFRTFEEKWDEKYERLIEFMKKNGREPKMIDEEGEELTLATWMTNQRVDNNKGKLPEARKQKLQALGVRLKTVSNENWEVNIERLRAFISVNSRWPKHNATDEEEIELITWVGHLKQAKKNGELSEEKIAVLERLGIVWEPHNTQWQKMFENLKTLLLEHGGKWLSTDDSSLESWIRRQRVAYRKGSLSTERIQALNALGIDWNPPRDVAWESKKLAMVEFFRIHNRPPSMTSDDPEECKLAQWIYNAREWYKRGRMSQDRKESLEAIHFTWEGKVRIQIEEASAVIVESVDHIKEQSLESLEKS